MTPTIPAAPLKVWAQRRTSQSASRLSGFDLSDSTLCEMLLSNSVASERKISNVSSSTSNSSTPGSTSCFGLSPHSERNESSIKSETSGRKSSELKGIVSKNSSILAIISSDRPISDAGGDGPIAALIEVSHSSIRPTICSIWLSEASRRNSSRPRSETSISPSELRF
ncbi:MAG: hypothetical protein IPQ00_11320 [Chloracidobacterium sp.]|nr:hypothetical protein [Chloracidobacterium sp.]